MKLNCLLQKRSAPPCAAVSSLVLALSLILSGCGAADAAPRADIYVDEAAVAETNTPSSEASEASSLTVAGANDLFEPLLPEIAADTPTDSGKVSAPATTGKTSASDPTEEELSVPEDDGRDYLEILFLGDAQFANARGTGTEIPEAVRGYLGEEDCRVYNLGVAGSAAALKRGERDMALDTWDSASFLGMAHLLHGDVSPDFLEKQAPDAAKVYRTMDKDRLDYIVIDYGINDFLNVTEIYDEDDPYDPTDFSHAYQKGLQLLNEACPQATILCCTPCYAQFFAQDGAYLGDGNTLSNGYGVLANYVGTVDYSYKQADNTLFVDMYHGSRMNLDAYTVSEYLSDGIHLTAAGRTAYGVTVARMIQKDLGIYTDEWSIIRIGVNY